MDNAFVIGDLHGCYTPLETLLKCWNTDREQLIFLGDYIDRGKESLRVLKKVMALVENYGAVALGGNHEDLFLEWLEHPEDQWFSVWKEDESSINEFEEISFSHSVDYYQHGGDKTINSLLEENLAYQINPSEIANRIKQKHPSILSFLKNRPYYFEMGNWVFVHAGVDLFLSDWKRTSEHDFKNIRSLFHSARNETHQKFVFGHHITKNFKTNKGHEVWISPCKTKIGIDGGYVFGGVLHGIKINSSSQIINYWVSKEGQLHKNNFII